MRAVVKKKKPLSSCHRRERMDFALRHRDWTLEDWKKVVWSDETKVNHLGSDGEACPGDPEIWWWISDGLGLHIVGRDWLCSQD